MIFDGRRATTRPGRERSRLGNRRECRTVLRIHLVPVRVVEEESDDVSIARRWADRQGLSRFVCIRVRNQRTDFSDVAMLV